MRMEDMDEERYKKYDAILTTLEYCRYKSVSKIDEELVKRKIILYPQIIRIYLNRLEKEGYVMKIRNQIIGGYMWRLRPPRGN